MGQHCKHDSKRIWQERESDREAHLGPENDRNIPLQQIPLRAPSLIFKKIHPLLLCRGRVAVLQ